MDSWNHDEKRLFSHLKTPEKIQNYLDSIPYDSREGTSSPRYVIREQTANCFEGAMTAAAMLEQTGHRPLIVDMIAENDDDHVIAVYKHHTFSRWGAIAKSNTTVLRYREPIYQNIRELVMSYFEYYLNLDGFKSLRSFSRPINLRTFNRREWRTTSESLDFIGEYLSEVHHRSILTPHMKRNLSKANDLLLKATLLGSRPEGLYQPTHVKRT